ncbi:TetR/AcrR family transcriptional regulator [Streptomyces bauhiniae]|uniref:TetR/AcrR family transcriptional regulator n=1 Tax=Streptomyces bauhiniae TaxID=2340725 RepID=UPI003652757F
MSTHTVDWAALRMPEPGPGAVAGLRERRKRNTRRLLVGTAVGMFLESGFDAVTVARIAEVCEVSPTTVFNYFPTKESLVLDLPPGLLAALTAALKEHGRTPTDAMLSILDGELDNLVRWLWAQPDYARAVDAVQRFEAMIRDTPALRAHQRQLVVRMADAACRTLAERAGLSAHDPEPQIAASALLGLWNVQVASSLRHLDARTPLEQVRREVAADVRRAAALLDAGLSDFAMAGAPQQP